MISLLATLLISYSANLIWDANPSEENVAGYLIFYGQASHSYSNIINVGNDTHIQLDNLEDGVLYYFSIKAYNSDGAESDYAEEIKFYNPIKLWLSGGILSTYLPVGNSYMLEKSYDFGSWQGLQTITPEKNEVQIPIDMTEQYAFYRIMKLDPQPQMAMKQVLRSLTAQITPPKIKKESWWKYNPKRYLKPRRAKGAYLNDN